MHGYQQGRGGDKDELQAPQADVWHGKEVIIADIFTAGLLSVACEVWLFVPPDALSGQNQYGDAEDEKDGEPDLPETGGVFVYAAQLGV